MYLTRILSKRQRWLKVFLSAIWEIYAIKKCVNDNQQYQWPWVERKDDIYYYLVQGGEGESDHPNLPTQHTIHARVQQHFGKCILIFRVTYIEWDCKEDSKNSLKMTASSLNLVSCLG